MNKDNICQICNRELIDGNTSRHHLIPQSKGGKDKDLVPLHKICHQKIHSIFSDSELKNKYYTIELLIAHPDMVKFVEWVKNKPPELSDTSVMSNRRRR